MLVWPAGRQAERMVLALRGPAAEFGVVAAKGVAHAGGLVARLADGPALPDGAREMFALLGADIAACAARLPGLDRTLARLHAADPVSRLRAGVPGIGLVGAVTLAR